MDHYQRLLQFEARNDYTGSKSDVYCKDVHGPGCKECKTCHFCRWMRILPLPMTDMCFQA